MQRTGEKSSDENQKKDPEQKPGSDGGTANTDGQAATGNAATPGGEEVQASPDNIPGN